MDRKDEVDVESDRDLSAEPLEPTTVERVADGRTIPADTETNGPSTAPPNAAAKPAVPDGGLQAWLQVLGAFVVMLLTWGIVNSFGVYQTYYETELLVGKASSSDISWIGSLQGALLMMGGLVSGPLFDAGYFRHLTSAGLLLVLLGLFMTSLCSAYWHIVLAQGVCVGAGSGLLFLPSAAVLSQYFARRRALVLGIQSVGSPLGGIVFPIVFARLAPRVGFAWASRVLAFIALALAAVPLAFLRPNPALAGPRPRRAFIDTAALREPPFAVYTLSGLVAFMGLYVPFFYLQLYVLRHGAADGRVTPYLVTLLNAGSVPGRLLPNFAADRLGSLRVLAATTLAAAATAYGWLGVRSAGGAAAFAVVFGFCNGGVTSLPPAAIASLTPDLSRLGARMGTAFAFVGAAVLVGTPVAGAILQSGTGADADAAWRGLILFSGTTLLAGSAGWAVTEWLRVRRIHMSHSE
ncbi:MFS general substrate transporter [Durotheca rogersii]|uniref:MFS general substrate transporter n=1 Tax=Durotheca rogersii TaxID=419775 RepID=UPI002220879E|nr:MFS general substrate transporter [Durotheca rogersii]KAI5857373.1 MFS general substrate transporter [Durotheca rogersii]